jgi:hypothetical protein
VFNSTSDNAPSLSLSKRLNISVKAASQAGVKKSASKSYKATVIVMVIVRIYKSVSFFFTTKQEKRKVLETMSNKALEAMWQQIWVQKCKSVLKNRSLIGTWSMRQETTAIAQLPPHDEDRPHVGFENVIGTGSPATN